MSQQSNCISFQIVEGPGFFRKGSRLVIILKSRLRQGFSIGRGDDSVSDTKTGQHTENPSEDVSDCGSVRVKLKRKDGEGTDTTAEKVNKKGQNLSCSVLFEHERRVVTEWHNCEGVEQIQD